MRTLWRTRLRQADETHLPHEAATQLGSLLLEAEALCKLRKTGHLCGEESLQDTAAAHVRLDAGLPRAACRAQPLDSQQVCRLGHGGRCAETLQLCMAGRRCGTPRRQSLTIRVHVLSIRLPSSIAQTSGTTPVVPHSQLSSKLNSRTRRAALHIPT